jgi:hypothetical protein
MNNKLSLASRWEKLDECRQNIVTIVLNIENPALRKHLEQVKSQWIPCNHHHDFPVFNRVPWSFGQLLLWSKPDLLRICRKVEL